MGQILKTFTYNCGISFRRVIRNRKIKIYISPFRHHQYLYHCVIPQHIDLPYSIIFWLVIKPADRLIDISSCISLYVDSMLTLPMKYKSFVFSLILFSSSSLFKYIKKNVNMRFFQRQ